jgi:hypothetical protein
MTGFDVIGDIHGHADALCLMLETLGYSADRGFYRHPRRKAAFVGDFIDRGPKQREVLGIVQGMCAAGSACAAMGNHEFNALAWATPDGAGGHHRSHSDVHRAQHATFLEQIGENSSAYYDALAWFRRLPVWLELDGIRVVHACWHRPSQEALRPHLDDHHCFTEAGFHAACRRPSKAYDAVDILLKGPEAPLPAGMDFRDKDGHHRTSVRLRWWQEKARTFRLAAIGMEGRELELPDEPVTSEFAYAEPTPVFFGHYWLTNRPILEGRHAACLDYSVAKKGLLAAYRWSGEQELQLQNFVAVSP